VGVARGRGRAPCVLARRRSVRGRPAPWHRHRRRCRGGRPGSGRRGDHLRGPGPDARADGHDRHRRGSQGVADAPRAAARGAWTHGGGGRSALRAGLLRRARARRAVRAPRGSGARRDVRRPAVAASAAGGTPSASARGAARTCSSGAGARASCAGRAAAGRRDDAGRAGRGAVRGPGVARCGAPAGARARGTAVRSPGTRRARPGRFEFRHDGGSGSCTGACLGDALRRARPGRSSASAHAGRAVGASSKPPRSGGGRGGIRSIEAGRRPSLPRSPAHSRPFGSTPCCERLPIPCPGPRARGRRRDPYRRAGPPLRPRRAQRGPRAAPYDWRR
jgi:hypothetical protein